MPEPPNDHHPAWLPIVVRVIVALIVATPFIAIILQAIGKIRAGH
jgi:hypothetical protein